MFDNNVPDELDDFFGGGGGPAALKFAEQNKWLSGTIFKIEIKNQIDMTTQQPKIDDRTGKPKQMCVLHLITDLRDPENPEDDGSRRQFLTGNMLWEFRQELQAQGVRKPQVGAKVATAWTGSKKSNFPQPQKLYTVKYLQPTAESAGQAVAHLANSATVKSTPTGDPFASNTSQPAAQRTTLDSMRSSDPFGDEPPF